MKLFWQAKRRFPRSFFRAALFLLAAVLLLPSFSVYVSADTQTGTDHDFVNLSAFSERFLCSEFSAHRGSAILSQDKLSVVFYFYGAGSYIDGKVADGHDFSGINALRFAVNDSNRSFDMNVFYSYEDEGDFGENDYETVSIDRSDIEQSYTVALPRASEIKRLRFVPLSSSVVRFSLSSLFAVSTFADSASYEGEVDRCELAADKKNIIIHGTLPRATVAEHSDAQIAEFVLGADELLPAKNAEPVRTAPISARFEFRLPFNDNSTLSSQKYIAVIITENGGILPIAPAKYADIAQIGEHRLSFKGLMGNGCTDIGEGTFIADADLSLLFDARSSGYAYKFEGEYYYFSQKEADKLKNTVSTASAKGCDILIRLVASNPEREVFFTYSYNESGVFYYALNASTEEGRKCIRAAINFINDKICPSACGYIVGKSIDTAGENNFVRAEQPLDEYSSRFMLALRTVCAEAKLLSPRARVFVGISNSWSFDEEGKNFLYPNYDSYLLLEALAKRAYAEGGVDFSVLVEAEGAPEDFGGGTALFGKASAFELISSLSERYGTLTDKAVLLWTPGENASASYAYLYYSALFSDSAECFCINLTSESARNNSELIPIVCGIDTVKTLILTAPHLNSVGVSAEAMPSYAPEKLVLRELLTAELLDTSPINALGRVTFRDYTQKSASPDLVRCADCGVLGYGLNYALCEFKDGSCPAILDLKGTDELSLTDTLVFDIMLECEGEREITVSVCSKNRETSYTKTLSSGTYRLYTDTPVRRGEGEYIKISLSGEGKLYIYEISGESASKFDGQLNSALNDMRGADAPIDETARNGWGLFIIFVLAVSCMSAVLMRRSTAQLQRQQSKNSQK
ncbi:MAG: hypothetical protein IKM09_04995 [Clostridia bacterium]|nr:hypothetical protein [Clostridia bacterium]